MNEQPITELQFGKKKESNSLSLKKELSAIRRGLVTKAKLDLEPLSLSSLLSMKEKKANGRNLSRCKATGEDAEKHFSNWLCI